MKQAIIYGGAFNPPTIAHQAILQACVTYAAENDAEIWILPSGERTDKIIGLPLDKRLKLLEAFIASVDPGKVKIRVEDHELHQPDPIQTVQTYQNLKQKYPECTQIWVFGSDSVLTMRDWEGGQKLYQNLAKLVVDRPGSELVTIPPNAQQLICEPPSVSSTLVRSSIAKGLPYKQLIPAKVYVALNN